MPMAFQDFIYLDDIPGLELIQIRLAHISRFSKTVVTLVLQRRNIVVERVN